jgi:hypothetical protein
MTEAEWLACEDPAAMVQFFPGASERKRKLFSCECCRQVWSLLNDPQRSAVEHVERYLATAARDDDLYLELAVEERAAEEDDFGPDGDYDDLAYALAHGVNWQAVAVVAEDTYSLREQQEGSEQEATAQAALLRDIFGNPFRPVAFSPEWRTSTAVALAQQMYESREFSPMPILADALQDAGCDNEDILDHCRGPGPHVRGCWVVDLVLGKA